MLRLLFLVLFLPGSAMAGDFAKEARSQSRYYGVGFQNDGNYWSIDLILGARDAQIAYPSLSCHGIWTLKATEENRLTFTEQILEGEDDCVVLGTTLLSPLENGRLLYEWSEFPPRIDARAVLLPLSETRIGYIELLKITLNGVALDFLLPDLKN